MDAKAAQALLASAHELLASGYIERITAETLAEYWLEAQFAADDADEPGGAAEWSEAQCSAAFIAAREALIVAFAGGG